MKRSFRLGKNGADGDRQSAVQLDAFRAQRWFGIYDVLNEKTAAAIWKKTNELLQGDGFGARDLILKSNVKVICTTDDPADALTYHQLLKESDFPVQVSPGFRPDKGLDISPGFADWVRSLESASGMAVTTYQSYLDALESRVRFFHNAGEECRIMR